MKRFISYNSIDQFRTVAKNVQHQAQFTGEFAEGENGETVPIYDRAAKQPVITARGTEKIHGTNAAVCYSIPDGFWVQSRKNIITPEKDNAACAFAVEANREAWMKIIHELADAYSIDLHDNIISVYFEWCGGNIQKKSAVSGLDKRAIIFEHFKMSPIEPTENEAAEWLPTYTYGGQRTFNVSDYTCNIFNICDFPTYEVEIDFENPLLSQNKMIEMVEELEKASPVGKAFDIEDNTGEGIVFTFEYKGSLYKFKVKGEEHAKGSGKVKTLTPVDEEFEQKKIDFVNNYACVLWRLEQMYNETFDVINGGTGDVKKTGDYLRAVITDVMKEEIDVLAELGIEPKQVNSMISKVARTYMMSRMDEELL